MAKKNGWKSYGKVLVDTGRIIVPEALISCPNCHEQTIHKKLDGKWYCWKCEKETKYVVKLLKKLENEKM